MRKTCCFLFVLLSLCLRVSAQVESEPMTLVPGQSIEREIAGGESHTYQIPLTVGQWMRVVVEQLGVDVVVALLGPDGKPVTEVNVYRSTVGLEPLSHEATVSGGYRIVVRPLAATALKGKYQARLEVKAAASAQDKQRTTAERLMAEAARLGLQGGVTAAQTIATGQQVLPLWRELGDRYWEAHSLHLIGQACLSGSKYDQAIESFNQTLAIRREVKDRAGEGSGLQNLGLAYFRLSRYEKAIEYYEQALAIHREVKYRVGEALTLNNLGASYHSLSHYEEAIESYERALAIHREMKNRTSEGITLGNLGEAYDALSRYEKAIEYHEQALAIHREVKNRASEGNALGNLGNAYRSQSRYEKAIEYHEQAVRIAREIKAQAAEASALNQLMLDWKALNLAPLAIYFGKQSVNAYQEIRTNLRTLDSGTQQSFLKSREEVYRTLADLLIAQGRLPEAEQVIRMLKEDEYFEYIRRDEANSSKAEKAALTSEEAALDKRYREIADKLTEIGTERGALLDKKTRTPEDEQRLAKLEADLVVAGQAFQKFLDGLAAEMSKNADTNARAFQLRESQGLMEDLRELGKGVVALYTLVGEEKYRVILTTADFQKGYEYPIKAEMRIKGSILQRKQRAYGIN